MQCLRGNRVRRMGLSSFESIYAVAAMIMKMRALEIEALERS